MQVTLHPAPPLLTQIKASLGIGKALRAMGLTEVAPLRGASLGNVALDLALRAVPLARDERCGKALCRWVNAIYGITHRHEQLNEATHELLPHLFGAGNLTGIEHGRKIFQRRAVYANDGSDAYLAHPERLRLPLLLVHGERNGIFHPEGSLRTLRWLQAANDPSLYERVVIPGYAHLDGLIGRSAWRDVYPTVSAHLDRFNC
jgi:cholesterol oxidase